MDKKRILLGHLNSNGDCLFATVIARQIKEVDYPNCHLTWAVNNWCKQAVLLNPYIDDIWEITTKTSLTTREEWENFVAQAVKRKESKDFAEVFLTQIIGSNEFNSDGGTRSSIYNNYPGKITVSHQPTIKLSDEEVQNVKEFAEQHELAKYKQVILVECGPESFSTALNPNSALEFADELTSKNEDIAVILSSGKKLITPRLSIIDASCISFRENAELSKYCDFFIGCSSGISWLLTTNWAKSLDRILIVDHNHPGLPSMVNDHLFYKLPTSQIIEIKSGENSMIKLKNCFSAIKKQGFEEARHLYHEKIRFSNYDALKYQSEAAFSEFNVLKFAKSINQFVRRNGIRILFTKQFLGVLIHLLKILYTKIMKIVGLQSPKP